MSYQVAVPSHPQKCRHDLLRPEVFRGDVERMLAAIRADPLTLLGPYGIERWMNQQPDVWTPGYRQGVRAEVGKQLGNSGKAEETREWILGFAASLTQRCEEFVLGAGQSFGGKDGHSEGTVVLRHPDDGTLMKRLQHRDIQGYLRIIGELTGVLNTKGSVKVEVNVSVAERLERARVRMGQPGSLESMLTTPLEPKAIEAEAETVDNDYDF